MSVRCVAAFTPVNDDELAVVEDYATTNSSTSVEAISYVPPAHICGNGIRTTAEACECVVAIELQLT